VAVSHPRGGRSHLWGWLAGQPSGSTPSPFIFVFFFF